MPSKTLHVDLYFTFGIETLKVLSIPREQFMQYSFRPLKWLRFVGYAIYGAEGDVFEMDGLRLVDYDAVTDASQLQEAYRFISPHKPHLVDCRAIDERASAITSSSVSTGRSEFEQKVQARDKGCVVTREVPSCPACFPCHILPFAKKDTYIKAVTRDRAKDDSEVTESINDESNGFTLLSALYFQFKRGSFTFLKTPNFALNTTDVPKATPFRVRGKSELDIPSDDSPRYTVHLFPEFAATFEYLAPSGADAWFPAIMEEGHSPPSTLLLDFWYGCVALRAWGRDAFRTYCKAKMDDIYYPQGFKVYHSSDENDDDDENERALERNTRALAGLNLEEAM